MSSWHLLSHAGNFVERDRSEEEKTALPEALARQAGRWSAPTGLLHEPTLPCCDAYILVHPAPGQVASCSSL